MKKILFLVVAFLLVFTSARADEKIYAIGDSVSREATENVQKIIPDFSFADTVKSMTQGTGGGMLDKIAENIKNILFGEITSSLKILGTVIVAGAICSLVTNMQSGFFKESTVRAVSLVCYMMIAGLTVEGFLTLTDMGSRAAGDVSNFMLAALPVYVALSLSAGAALSGAAMIPSIGFSVGLCSIIINKICLPGIYLSLATSLVGEISGRAALKDMSALIRKVSMWIMTGAVTISVAVIGIGGFASGTLDGVAAKGVKFTVSTLVPVLGGALSDAADTVLGSALILKNAAGAAGMLFILFIILYPVLKISVVALIYKVAGILVGIIADRKVSGILLDMGDILSTLCGILIFEGAGAVIMIAAIVNGTNMGSMLR